MRKTRATPPDVEHRRGVAHLGRNRSDSLDRVDQDGEADGERDDADLHRVAEAEHDHRRGHDRDRRRRTPELDERLERAPCTPLDEPISKPEPMPMPAPTTKPTASRSRLRSDTRSRNSLVGQTSQAVRSTELGRRIANEPLLRAHTSHAPSASANTATPSSGRPARASAARHYAPPFALRRPRRRPAARGAQPRVDEVAEQCPTATTAAYSSGMRTAFCCCCMYEPMPPPVPITNSAVTQTSSASEALTRMPVAMLGSAAGSVTRTSRPHAPDAGRSRDVVQEAVGAADAVDRVDEDRPDGGEGDHEAAHRRVEAEEQDRELDERDGRDRPQELDHDRRGVQQRPRGADRDAPAARRRDREDEALGVALERRAELAGERRPTQSRRRAHETSRRRGDRVLEIERSHRRLREERQEQDDDQPARLNRHGSACACYVHYLSRPRSAQGA